MKKIVVNKYAPEEFITLLKKEGFCPIPTMDIGLSSSLSTHADLQIHRLDKETFICTPQCFEYYRNLLPEYRIIKGMAETATPYPKDIPYNVLRVGEVLIHHIDSTDSLLLSYYSEKGMKFLPVRQGYVACSVLKVSDNAIITADKGIAKCYKGETLCINSGGIFLEGFNYGFIGGCGGLVTENKLFICGDITKHQDYQFIRNFCIERNVEICNSNGVLTDIGGIV